VRNLDNVRIVQMLVFVASTPDSSDQSRVADAAGELLVEVLGEIQMTCTTVRSDPCEE
jgi:hypothetical protein